MRTRDEEVISAVRTHLQDAADTFAKEAKEGYHALMAEAIKVDPEHYEAARYLATLVRIQRALRAVRGI